MNNSKIIMKKVLHMKPPEPLVIKIVQDSQSIWHIEDSKGHIWHEGVTVSNEHDAREVLTRYMTSFMPWQNWEFQVVSLKGNKKNI